MTPLPAMILFLLRTKGPMSGREIVADLPGFGAEHVRSALWQMAMSDRVAIVRGPRFALPPHGEHRA